jgi:DNA end-binding protein Ku
MGMVSFMHVVAMIHHENDAYGVSFPDFPGCTTVASDLEGAISKAAEVLAFHAEGLAEDGSLATPRTLTQLKQDQGFLEDSKDALLVLVPYEPPSRAARINVTIEESLLSRIDRAAEAAGESRSGYLATSARIRMGRQGASDDSLQNRSISEAEGLRYQVPIWKGYLKLSLVSCSVALYPTSRMGETRDSPPVSIDPREFDKQQSESTHTIDIASFFPLSELDIRFIKDSFYLVPYDELGQEAFAVIRDAMSNKRMLGISYVTLSRQERAIAFEAFGEGMRAATLRYPHEIRSEAELFANIPHIRSGKDMLQLAERILDSKAEHFNPHQLDPRYKAAHQTRRGKRRIIIERDNRQEAPSNVIDLIDALKRSLKRSSEVKRPSHSKSAKTSDG